MAAKMIYDANDGMQNKWKAFTKKINTKTDDSKTLLKMMKIFLSEPFNAAIKNQEYIKQWTASICKWRDAHSEYDIGILEDNNIK